MWKPNLGVVMWRGVWPPINPRHGPGPEREFWPAAPRPAKRPRPRPTRFLDCLEPGAGLSEPKWRVRRGEKLKNNEVMGSLILGLNETFCEIKEEGNRKLARLRNNRKIGMSSFLRLTRITELKKYINWPFSWLNFEILCKWALLICYYFKKVTDETFWNGVTEPANHNHQFIRLAALVCNTAKFETISTY